MPDPSLISGLACFYTLLELTLTINLPFPEYLSIYPLISPLAIVSRRALLFNANKDTFLGKCGSTLFSASVVK